jgi:hypothetical protein
VNAGDALLMPLLRFHHILQSFDSIPILSARVPALPDGRERHPRPKIGGNPVQELATLRV